MADRDTMPDDRSPEEIRREIERTRSYMDQTVEAIGDRLSPGRIVDELWLRARSGDGRAAMADTVRDHPIPFALMGLGLGWLALEQSRGRADGVGEEGTYGRAEGRVGPYRGDAVDRDDPEWEHAGMGTKLKAKASGAVHAVADAATGAAHSVADAGRSVGEKAASATRSAGEKVSGAAEMLRDRAGGVRESAAHAGEVVSERVSGAADAVGERVAGAAEAVGGRVAGAASAVADGARRGAEKAKDGFWQLLDQNPMALGAIAFGIGLASGISAPSTRLEDERLGRFSGPLKDEAKRAAQDTAQKVKGVAQDAYSAARDELRRKHEEVAGSESFHQLVDQLKDSAREIGRAAQDAARERAGSEELTAEGMKKMVDRVKDRTRETATD